MKGSSVPKGGSLLVILAAGLGLGDGRVFGAGLSPPRGDADWFLFRSNFSWYQSYIDGGDR